MRRFIGILAAAAIFTAGVVPAVVEAAAKEQQQISLEQLPAPVKTTLEKEAKDGSLGKITKETDKRGKTFYEAQIQKKGKDRYVHVSEDGKVLKHESAKAEAKEEAKRK